MPEIDGSQRAWGILSNTFVCKRPAWNWAGKEWRGKKCHALIADSLKQLR